MAEDVTPVSNLRLNTLLVVESGDYLIGTSKRDDTPKRDDAGSMVDKEGHSPDGVVYE